MITILTTIYLVLLVVSVSVAYDMLNNVEYMASNAGINRVLFYVLFSFCVLFTPFLLVNILIKQIIHKWIHWLTH